MEAEVRGLQVLAMSISRCPQNRMLKATYTESNTAAFQDGVGAALLNIARAVPDGMLVFLPSYTMMDKLCARWRVSGANPHTSVSQVKETC